MLQKNNILIIGVGNTLRGDDGIGAYVCQKIDKAAIAGVTTTHVHQLHIEQAEEFYAYNILIIADAAATGSSVTFKEINAADNVASPASHHINPATLLALIQRLYTKKIQMYLCQVPVQSFKAGETLSAAARHNAGIAAGIIINWIGKL